MSLQSLPELKNMIFHIFPYFRHFFRKMCKTFFGISPWIESIECSKKKSFKDIDLLVPEIHISKDSTVSRPRYLDGYTLKLPICRILASGPFALQPYYSRGENSKFYSTSHVNRSFMMKNAGEDFDYH